MLLEFKQFAIKRLELEDHHSLIESLEDLEISLHEKIKEMETTHVKQHYKKVRKFRDTSELSLSVINDVDVKTVSKMVVLQDPEVVFESDELNLVFLENSWVSEEEFEIIFFTSDDEISVDKYRKVVGLVPKIGRTKTAAKFIRKFIKICVE